LWEAAGLELQNVRTAKGIKMRTKFFKAMRVKVRLKGLLAAALAGDFPNT
jgi:hypothetical protein